MVVFDEDEPWNIETMKNGERQDVVLSEICCQYLKDIQDVSYALAYTLLYLRDYKVLQRRFRSISPKVQEERDWVRIRFDGMVVAFSISDEAIEFYRQAIYEFQCFGSTVRIISIYENYIRRIVEISRTSSTSFMACQPRLITVLQWIAGATSQRPLTVTAPTRICYTFSMVIFRVSPFFKS